MTPTTVYAGTEHSGVFKSTDGGGSWRAVNTGLTNGEIYELVIDPAMPTTLYAGTNSGGIFKSTNGGEEWNAANNGLADPYVYGLAIDPAVPTTLYAATLHGGVFKSTDGGGRWNPAKAGLPDAYYATLVIDPATPTTLYVGASDGGIFKSTDGGGSWNASNTGLTSNDITDLVIHPRVPTTLYAQTSTGSVYQSIDGGANWHSFDTDVVNNRITALAFDKAELPTLYAGTWDGRVSALAAPTPSNWREIMDGVVREELQKSPLAGMTLAIARPVEPTWVQPYGYANLEQVIPATPDTVYQIGSLTVQFTAAAVMQLVEKGQLDLNAPISQYLEGLPPELQSLTLHQLLTHTSRVSDSYDTTQMLLNPQAFTSEMLLRDVIPAFDFSPESTNSAVFSLGNYILAGLIIEKVSGLSYADYLKQYVFSPAGLQHTDYCPVAPAGVAPTYFENGAGFTPVPLNSTVLFAAGGLCSTAGDLVQWMKALAAGQVVQPDTYRKMIATEVPDGSDVGTGYGFYASQSMVGPVILGFGVLEGAGYTSYLISLPEKDLTIVVLSNTYRSENTLLGAILEKTSMLMP
jgi:CubicO group peptidase (beta-lactamase class C family)